LRDALRDNPGSIDALTNLSVVLPQGEGGEVADWFAKMPAPAIVFRQLAEHLVEQDRRDALEPVVARMRKIAPDDKQIEEFAFAARQLVDKSKPPIDKNPAPAQK